MSVEDTKVTQVIHNVLTKSDFEGAESVDPTQLYYIDPEFTGGKVLITDTNGDIVESTTSSSELGQKIGYTLNSASVVGTTKDVAKTSPECLYVPNGLIMGGSAAAAGLVTRGVCGVSQPDDTGACTKENLYINYDSDNNWNPNGRGLVINAGSVGTNLGQNMYQYCAVRGDIVKAWVEANVYNGVDSTSTTQPLSANQGKVLQGEIDNLKSFGRYMSLWSTAEGKPMTDPSTSPYTFTSGCYFVVSEVAAEGGTNYKPDGNTYTIGQVSTTVESNSVKPGDLYLFDGTNWTLQHNADRSTVTDVLVNDTSVVDTDGVATIPVTSSSTFGASKVDGTSITATNGVVSVNQNQTIRLVYTDGTEANLSLFGVLS